MQERDPEREMAKYMKNVMNEMESVLSTRVPDDTFRGILNFYKTFLPNTPHNDIEKELVS